MAVLYSRRTPFGFVDEAKLGAIAGVVSDRSVPRGIEVFLYPVVKNICPTILGGAG